MVMGGIPETRGLGSEGSSGFHAVSGMGVQNYINLQYPELPDITERLRAFN